LLRKTIAGLIGLSLCIGLPFTTPSAARTIYECKIKEQGVNRGWLPEVVVVAYEPGADTVQVNDPMIQYVHGSPIEVKVKTDNDARLSVSWKLTLPSSRLDEFQFTFDFSIFKADRRAKIKATPNGGYYVLNSTGTCKVLEG
jgi:hypothetical protein